MCDCRLALFPSNLTPIAIGTPKLARKRFEMNLPVRWRFALPMRLNVDSRPRNRKLNHQRFGERAGRASRRPRLVPESVGSSGQAPGDVVGYIGVEKIVKVVCDRAGSGGNLVA